MAMWSIALFILITNFAMLFQDDIEIDLDEVLDMESEMERRQYINVSFTLSLRIAKFTTILDIFSESVEQ